MSKAPETPQKNSERNTIGLSTSKGEFNEVTENTVLVDHSSEDTESGM